MFRLLSTLFLLCILTGCASKNAETLPSPVPQEKQDSVKEENTKKSKPSTLSYEEDAQNQYVVVEQDTLSSISPQGNEPQELVELLNAKGTVQKEDTAVSRLRPEAMRDAANLVTLQTAMAYEYARLLQETEKYTSILDTAFNFSPLMMTHGDALIMPPILTKAGASMRMESIHTVSTAKTTYELLENAQYVSTVPTWRIFLMAELFPKAEKPHPAVLPKNSEEQKLWRSLVREAWAQGIQEARELYAENMARMTQSYKGVMLYHLLTAQHLVSEVQMASSELGSKTSNGGSKLHIGQKVYRITSPSRFLIKGEK